MKAFLTWALVAWTSLAFASDKTSLSNCSFAHGPKLCPYKIKIINNALAKLARTPVDTISPLMQNGQVLEYWQNPSLLLPYCTIDYGAVAIENGGPYPVNEIELWPQALSIPEDKPGTFDIHLSFGERGPYKLYMANLNCNSLESQTLEDINQPMAGIMELVPITP